MEALQMLSRSEMKLVMAGLGGNIYCSVGGEQVECRDGFSLSICLDACIGLDDEGHGECGGCAQFPEMY